MYENLLHESFSLYFMYFIKICKSFRSSLDESEVFKKHADKYRKAGRAVDITMILAAKEASDFIPFAIIKLVTKPGGIEDKQNAKSAP